VDELLNLARMARRIGVTIRWLKDEADAQRVPCLRAGRAYLFLPSAVQKALAIRAAAMLNERGAPLQQEVSRA